MNIDTPTVSQVSTAKFVPAVLLCFLLGVLGAHRFYLGKFGTGLLMLLTSGGLGIWTLIDFVRLLLGSLRDKNDLPLLR